MLKYPIIHDGSPTIKTDGENYYNALMKIYYESGSLKEVTDSARDKGEVGIDNTKDYINVLLTTYLVNIDSLYCASGINKSALNQYKDTFKLVCIRNTMVCRLRDTTTIDLMLAYVVNVENSLFGDVFIDEDGDFITQEDSDCFKYLT
jgi:hypothetical protein